MSKPQPQFTQLNLQYLRDVGHDWCITQQEGEVGKENPYETPLADDEDRYDKLEVIKDPEGNDNTEVEQSG